MVGALLYASLSTRLDITHGVHQLTIYVYSIFQLSLVNFIENENKEESSKVSQGTSGRMIGLQFGGCNNRKTIN